MIRFVVVLCWALCSWCSAFAPPLPQKGLAPLPRGMVVLEAAKKKRRRRKKLPDPAAPSAPSPEITKEVVAPPVEAEAVLESKSEAAATTEPAVTASESTAEPEATEPSSPPPPKKTSSLPKDLQEVLDFKFDPDAKVKFDAEDVKGFQDMANEDVLEDAVELPDIKELSKSKELEKALQKLEDEKMAQKPKIRRSDIKAFNKLLETNPYIDSDDSFFEEEEYGTVEALLGERAKPFLGIPTGPLQVGHFVGALTIALMGFVEYPGFPLTNLPTPLRSCFQGGLATVYAINAVLAVVAVFKAMERGQPPVLWATKTFTVGGLAFDQLTQLPTLDQAEKIKNQKGARALKNKKR